jgi:putative methyltransferase (TIGR04325 family)
MASTLIKQSLIRPKARQFIEAMAPPILKELRRRFLSRNQIRFVGDFKSWREAEAASAGYSAQVILDRTIQAARKVKSGRAVFERDAVAFDKIEYNFPLVWALMRVAARHGRLHVLDFGGALGSTYFQSRPLINAVSDLRWAIVEQPAHVAAGAKEFADGQLTFHNTIDNARQHEEYDVCLLSGVIQCLPDPLDFVRSILTLEFPTIILDRTPFMLNGATRLTVQYVPEWIYPASYPAWFFSEAKLLNIFTERYELMGTWPALDKLHPEGGRAEYRGFLFELKET